jgi:translation initiation factor 2B subunit (eIF-2B alpha/beta/delta family)
VVTKTGGILAKSGSLPICISAYQSNVQVIILTNSIKLTSQIIFEQQQFNNLVYEEDGIEDSKFLKITPKYDFIKPMYIKLILTTNGAYSPDNIYRLFNQYYEG